MNKTAHADAPPHPVSVRWQLWIVAVGFFMQSLDTTIVNTALPSMAKALGTSPLNMHMVIVCYVLTVAVMLPLSGWLSDRCGVRNVFCGAISLFTLGSLCCALSANTDQLILSRILQGIGGAMMVPVGRLTVMKIVPRAQYMAAMTFVTLPGQLGPLAGPTLGGILVEYASWHWIFLINLPVGIIGIIATLKLLPNYRLPPRRFDFGGFLLLAIPMATLTLALESHQWTITRQGVWPWLLLSCGIGCLLWYPCYARHRDNALFSLDLFKNRVYRTGLIGSMLARTGSGMLPFVMPLFLQLALGYSPFHAGLMMIPMVVGSMLIKRVVVRLVNRAGYRNALTGATLLLGTIVLLLPLLIKFNLQGGLPLLLFLLGGVNSIRFTTMNTLTLKELPDTLASSGNSLLSMVMQLSMSTGVSLAGLLLAAFSGGQVTDKAAMLSTFSYLWVAIGIFLWLPVAVFWFIPAGLSRNSQLKKSGKPL
ncbi:MULTISPECIES: multidrug transporter subunit MdtD [Tatumella]|uniref:Multidrug transporter subunit MdtD n=1 Tax=Tatumella punctata TaxID=399969 RepID=A0ABW1VMW7_9GAMM|nr:MULTISPECIES: multidrug transporter subunit MdtD [unclassified Tatumella]MBS0854800.1 multidrug transporter subunit MdtD [Tatumella sp. JGM16]MBS0892954.1 multidrug transporter subunit MdtD [Tatumella sp. JGM130]MBS0912238.1 multidrug transporter subunit MdtD [Tatumella sp. JGM91]